MSDMNKPGNRLKNRTNRHSYKPDDYVSELSELCHNAAREARPSVDQE
jgi:hypothetical protein